MAKQAQPPDASERTLQRALEAGFRQIAHKPRTVAEVRARLEAKGVAPELVETVIIEMCAQGYLDDARFAADLAAEKRELHGWGNERLERRLAAAGVDAEVIAATIGSSGYEAELEAALVLLRRRFPTPPTDDQERQRALAMLVRKGYELELCYDAIRAHGSGGGA